VETGIEGMEWMGRGPNPHEKDPGAVPAGSAGWGGTGLCAEAQADGVPCTVTGRSCDTCGRAVGRSRAGPATIAGVA
jgi:hypothetical protein